MNATDIKEVLGVINATNCIKERGEWVMCPCPFAPWLHAKGSDRKPSFGVKIEPDSTSAYHCFTCKEKGRLFNLADRIAALGGKKNPLLARMIADRESLLAIPPWADSTPLVVRNLPEPMDEDEFDETFPSVVKSADARHYLNVVRGIPCDYAVFRDLRLDFYRKRILFKIKRDGLLYGTVGRLYVNNPRVAKVRIYFKAKVSMFLLGEEMLDPDDTRPLIVVEGGMGLLELDSCSLTKYGSAVALMGSSLSEEQADRLIEIGRPIIFLLDRDPAGYAGERQAMKLLRGRADAVLGKWPEGVEDLSELTRRDLREIVSESLSFIT